MLIVSVPVDGSDCWPLNATRYLCNSDCSVIIRFFFFIADWMKAWHKKCYKCKECRKHLDSTNTCEGPDNEIYCKGNHLIRDTISINHNQPNKNHRISPTQSNLLNCLTKANQL